MINMMTKYFYKIVIEDKTFISKWFESENDCVNECIEKFSKSIKEGKTIKGCNITQVVLCEDNGNKFSYLLVKYDGDGTLGIWYETRLDAINNAIKIIKSVPYLYDSILIISKR